MSRKNETPRPRVTRPHYLEELNKMSDTTLRQWLIEHQPEHKDRYSTMGRTELDIEYMRWANYFH